MLGTSRNPRTTTGANVPNREVPESKIGKMGNFTNTGDLTEMDNLTKMGNQSIGK